MKLIGIQTTRYSAVMKRILGAYGTDVEILIRYQRARPDTFRDADVPQLLENWCTNDRVKKTLQFNLKQNGVELFGFHDHPDNLWADISVLPFVQDMATDKMIRYDVSEVREPKIWTWIKRIIGRTEQHTGQVSSEAAPSASPNEPSV